MLYSMKYKISDPWGSFSCDSFLLNYSRTWKRKEKNLTQKQHINNVRKIILEPQWLVLLQWLKYPRDFKFPSWLNFCSKKSLFVLRRKIKP